MVKKLTKYFADNFSKNFNHIVILLKIKISF